jgi:hypothetical protein
MSSLRVTAESSNHPLDANQFFASPRGQRLLTAVSDKTGIAASEVKAKLLGGTSLQDLLRANGLTFADIQQALHSMSSRSDSVGERGPSHPSKASAAHNPQSAAAYTEGGGRAFVSPEPGQIDIRG